MREYVTLKKLPKAVNQCSLNFRNTTPGSIAGLFFSGHSLRSKKLVDPSHPAAAELSSQIKKLPKFKSDLLTVRAAPKALLVAPEVIKAEDLFAKPHKSLIYPRQLDTFARPFESLYYPKHINMSIQFSIAMKQDDVKFPNFARGKIKTKIKQFVSLIVTRGIMVENVDGKDRLVLDSEAPTGKDILLQGWTYFFSPRFEFYLMTPEKMIPLLTDALKTIHMQAISLETLWKKIFGEKAMSGHDEISFNIGTMHKQTDYVWDREVLSVPDSVFGFGVDPDKSNTRNEFLRTNSPSEWVSEWTSASYLKRESLEAESNTKLPMDNQNNIEHSIDNKVDSSLSGTTSKKRTGPIKVFFPKALQKPPNNVESDSTTNQVERRLFRSSPIINPEKDTRHGPLRRRESTASDRK